MSEVLAGALRWIRGRLLGVSPEEIRYTFEDVRSELRAARAELKAEIAALRAELDRLAPGGEAARGAEDAGAIPPPTLGEPPEEPAEGPTRRRQPRRTSARAQRSRS